MRNICILKDIQIHATANGIKDQYSCTSAGDEDKVLFIGEGEPDKSYRHYVCANCGTVIDGEETFEEARKHLGKSHDLIDPFN